MKVDGDASLIIAVTVDAHRRSVEESAEQARLRVPRLTGRLANDIAPVMSGDGLSGGFGSTLPYAGVVESGYDAGPRRGPHMRGSYTIAAVGREWLQRMADAHRSIR